MHEEIRYHRLMNIRVEVSSLSDTYQIYVKLDQEERLVHFDLIPFTRFKLDDSRKSRS